MAIENINIGNLANDGTGDDLRTAFIKVNNNFTELDDINRLIEVEGNNLGTSPSSEGVFANKIDNVLNFKSLNAGSGINLSANSTSVTIDAAVGISDLIFTTDNGSIIINDTQSSGTVNFEGGAGIVVEKLASPTNTIRVRATTGVLEADTQPRLNAPLDAVNNNITNVNQLSANTFVGNLEGLVHGLDIRDINDRLFETSFDFGEFSPSFTNLIDFIVYNTEIDFGSFTAPADFEFELGTF